MLTSLLDLAGSGGRRDAFLIKTEAGLAISLLLLGMALRVNLQEIFFLKVLVLLSV